jgi:hypothetical protein
MLTYIKQNKGKGDDNMENLKPEKRENVKTVNNEIKPEKREPEEAKTTHHTQELKPVRVYYYEDNMDLALGIMFSGAYSATVLGVGLGGTLISAGVPGGEATLASGVILGAGLGVMATAVSEPDYHLELQPKEKTKEELKAAEKHQRESIERRVHLFSEKSKEKGKETLEPSEEIAKKILSSRKDAVEPSLNI